MCEVVVAEGEGIIMSAPNMATITASLEKCLQNCSLNKHQSSSRGNRVVDELGKTRSSSNSSTSYNNDNLDLMLENHEDHYYYYNNIYSSSQQLQTDAHALDLNSQSSLPYHWEQCLDLKSGEIYYINWRTGVKAKEDPRSRSHKEMIVNPHHHHNYYFEEEEEEEEGKGGDEDDDDEDEEDDGSSSSSTTSSDVLHVYSSPREVAAAAAEVCSSRDGKDERSRQVLVVAGCKLCLMYFMVPKQLQLCPKCTSAQLLHF